MSTKILLSILYNVFLFHECNGAIFREKQFIANTNNKFANHTIVCNDNQNCTILCNDHRHSCLNTKIYCPSTGNCDIKCKSGPSNNVCENILVSCPINGNCDISCTSESACKHAFINGNTSDSLTITCKGNNTCQNTHIDARYTNNFLLHCGTGSINTCASLNMYFPPNNGNKKATIIAGDECSAGTNNIPMIFHAYNGWNDINIIDYIGTYDHQIGTMYCGQLYELSCPFKSNAWECAHINDSCNNPFNIKQTEIETLSNRPVENTDQLLYGIITILIICVCCLGGLCLYFMKQTQQQYGKTMKNSNSELEKTKSVPLPTSTTTLQSVNSISKSTTVNQTVTVSPVTMIRNNSNNISNNSTDVNMMRAYRSYSNRSYSAGNELEMRVINEESNQNINNNNIQMPYLKNNVTESATPQPSSPRTSTNTTDQNTPVPTSPNLNANSNTDRENIDTPIQMYPTHLKNNKHQFLYNIPAPIQDDNNNNNTNNKHIEIPSTTTSFQPSLSSNNASNNSTHIVYQHPQNQHQQLQLISIMNQSAPPSLSEIIKNNNFPINQNPIPPTNEQSFDTPRYSGSITNTITITNTNTITNKHKIKATPTESTIESLSNIYSNSLESLDDENENESDGNNRNDTNTNKNANINISTSTNVIGNENIINQLQTAVNNYLVNNTNNESDISVDSNIDGNSVSENVNK